jgi:predicted esterase
VRYLDRVADWTRRELGCAAERRVVLGLSQGAATAWRWAALGSPRLDRPIGWGSELPPDLDLAEHPQRFAATRLQLVRGDRDAVHTEAMLARDRERLSAAGLTCEVPGFEGGYELAAGALASIAHGSE